MDNHDSDDRKIPSKDPTSADPDSVVGSCRPPEHTQFQPGTSGNRRGRPPGSKNRKTVIAEVAEEMHWVVENGKRERRSTLELMLQLIRNKALAGDLKAFRALHELQVKFAPQTTNEDTGWLLAPAEVTPEEWIAREEERNKHRKPPPRWKG